jgi:ABC-type Mn2+/Zn2+ transport system ATPase subunit
MENILAVDNLNVSFWNRSIIRNLTFDVTQGDNLAVIGPNGAGKTVLLKALLGLIPLEGKIRWSAKARLCAHGQHRAGSKRSHAVRSGFAKMDWNGEMLRGMNAEHN